MLSTAVTTPRASSQSAALATSAVSKDDSAVSASTRHPSGAAPSHRPVGATLSMGSHGPLPEFRSKHRSASARSPPPRLNLYKRTDVTTGQGSPRLPSEQNNNHDVPACVHSSRSEDGTRSPKPFKRETWLQRSWRTARSHRLHTNSTYQLSNDAPKTPLTDRPISEIASESGKKSPLVTHANPLAGFLERIRQRSGSDAASAERSTLSLGVKRKKGLINIDSPRSGRSMSPAANAQWTYERRGSACGSPSKEYEDEDAWNDVFSDDAQLKPARRKRSSSDTAKYLIMRKTSRPNTAEVMGSINRRDVAYKQLLKKFTCYDLMPTQGALVAVDSQLSTRLALTSLAENGVRAAFIWDSKQRAPIGFLTVTDFLRIIYSHFSAASPVSETGSSRSRESLDQCQRAQAELEDILERPILSNLLNVRNVESSKLPKRHTVISISCEDTLLSAMTVLRLNRLHRIPVLEAETSNPLFLLSSKRLLQFLHEYMHSLPMSAAMYKTLDELRIGTWITDSSSAAPLVSLTSDSSMTEAVEKFLQSGASSLPVLRFDNAPATSGDGDSADGSTKFRLVDSLTKVDLMHFVLVNGWSDLHEKTVADVLNGRDTCMERLVTCHRRTTLALTIDRFASSQAHRLYIVDSEGALYGILSIGDLLSYLNDKSLDEPVQKM